MSNVLATIVNHKRELIANTPDRVPASLSQRDFKAALSKSEFGFIMECKKASPSRGLIRSDFNLEEIVPIYNQYADAISVLTEDRFFQGSFNNLQYVSQHTDKPVLCKDFVLEPKQVRQARFYGADAILLMLSVLSDDEYLRCAQEAKKYQMDVLTEVHTEAELERAIHLNSEIIGINNRNLKDLTTSFAHTEQLAAKIPNDRIIVTESGINNHQDVLQLSILADACLVGSALMSQEDLALAAMQLVHGDIKICGVTNQQDMDYINKTAASSLGVIFAEKSKRLIKDKVKAEKKPLIGVFQDQPLKYIVSQVQEYGLKGVQLHGSEDQNYINKLRKLLGNEIYLSKVIHVNGTIPELSYEQIDEILLDTQIGKQQGGTGETFDWGLLDSKSIQSSKHKLRIAGGLDASNIAKLKSMGFCNIDICSGSELSAGKKCPNKLKQIFQNSKLQGRAR